MNLEALLGGGAAGSPESLLLMMLPIAGGVLLLLAFAMGGGQEKKFKDRVQRIKTGGDPTVKLDPTKKLSAKKSLKDSEIKALDTLIKSLLPRRDLLRRRIEAAGLTLPLGRYLGICIGVGIATLVGTIIWGKLPFAACFFIGFIAGVGLPHLVVGFLAKRRRNKFVDNFPDAIDLMVRGLKSGLPISESIKAAGAEVPDPVGEELRKVTDAVRLGSKLEEVLWETADRLDMQEFKFFTVSLAIQSETGGNLSESLANLSSVLRGRRQLKLKIKAMSSEAKTSAYIIGALPFVVGSFIYIVNNSYIMKLFIDPRGHIMLGVGATMFLIGGTIMYKMVKFEI